MHEYKKQYCKTGKVRKKQLNIPTKGCFTMSKYLSAYNLTEKWEVFKSVGTYTVFPLVSAIENLSQNPTEENVDEVRDLENLHKEEISELDSEDREVLEDMIVRQLFQAQRQYRDNYTRWKFAMQRASDMGLGDSFEVVNDIIDVSEEAMKNYANSGDSPEKYVSTQQDYLDELNSAWKKTEKEMKDKRNISEYYYDYFERQFQRKRGVIERHIQYFRDNSFGQWVAGLRNKKGWSLATAAKNTGVSASYIHRIEKGTRGIPSFTKLNQLAVGYDVPTSEMITMASSGIKTLEDYVAEGAFLINGGLATDNQKGNIADLMTLITEGTEKEAIEQLLQVRKMINDN